MDISILLTPDQKVYLPGQFISGVVKLVPESEIYCKEIFVKLKGKGKVRYTDDAGKDTFYTSIRNYITMNTHLATSEDGNNIVIYPGKPHEYPFSFLLPPNIPSSIEVKEGYVRYRLKAVVNCGLLNKYSKKIFVSVNHLYDLNKVPEANMPLSFETIIKAYCCFGFCKVGPVKWELRAPRKGVVPGEALVLYGQVENNTDSFISKCEMQLVQVATVIGDLSKDGKIKHSKTNKFIIFGRDLGVLNPREYISLDEITLNIPSLPPSTMQNCDIIYIKYCIQIVATFELRKASAMSIPIIIGSIPVDHDQERFADFNYLTPTDPAQHELPNRFTPFELSGDAIGSLYPKKKYIMSPCLNFPLSYKTAGYQPTYIAAMKNN